MSKPETTGRPADQEPSANERAEMITALVNQGYKATELADIIAPGRTRRHMATDLIAMQRNAPSAI